MHDLYSIMCVCVYVPPPPQCWRQVEKRVWVYGPCSASRASPPGTAVQHMQTALLETILRLCWGKPAHPSVSMHQVRIRVWAYKPLSETRVFVLNLTVGQRILLQTLYVLSKNWSWTIMRWRVRSRQGFPCSNWSLYLLTLARYSQDQVTSLHR